MDLNEDVRAAHKRVFLKFFEQSELSTELKKDINTMINKQERRLIIKLSHFDNHREGADLARRIMFQKMLNVFLVLSLLSPLIQATITCNSELRTMQRSRH